MKSVLIYFSTSLLIIIAACTPEPIVECPDECPVDEEKPCVAAEAPIYHPGEMSYGRVAGLKNCRPFMASATSFTGKGEFPIIGIGVNTYEDWDGFFANKEIIGFCVESLETGTWPILLKVDSMPNVNFHYYYTSQDHDVSEDRFKLDTTYPYNRMHLSEIDTLNRKISGWFECRWVIDDANPSGRHPDTILFTHCYFEARTL